MTKTEIYNEDYTKLNHAYIQIFETYQKLAEAKDVDVEVANILGQILMVFNPTLDKIKSEMTVKTRFKEDFNSKNENTPKKSSKSNIEKEVNDNGGVIFHPKFN